VAEKWENWELVRMFLHHVYFTVAVAHHATQIFIFGMAVSSSGCILYPFADRFLVPALSFDFLEA